MSEDEQEFSADVRRVSSRQRKKRLDARGPLFPSDAPDEPDAPDAPVSASPSARSRSDDEPELDGPLTLDIPADLAGLFDERAQRPARPGAPGERYPPLPHEMPPEQPASHRPTPRPVVRRRRGSWRYNLLSLLFLLGTGLLIAYFVMVWRDPYNITLNPLAPPTPFVVVTWTPAPEVSAPQAAAPPLIDLPPFAMSEGGVRYTANSNSEACNWASIAGTVTGIDGEALNGLVISTADAENPADAPMRVYSGASLAFGAGGYEVLLGGAPVSRTYRVQLLSAAGAPLSPVYTITTRDTCEENVARLDFVQLGEM